MRFLCKLNPFSFLSAKLYELFINTYFILMWEYINFTFHQPSSDYTESWSLHLYFSQNPGLTYNICTLVQSIQGELFFWKNKYRRIHMEKDTDYKILILFIKKITYLICRLKHRSPGFNFSCSYLSKHVDLVFEYAPPAVTWKLLPWKYIHTTTQFTWSIYPQVYFL